MVQRRALTMGRSVTGLHSIFGLVPLRPEESSEWVAEVGADNSPHVLHLTDVRAVRPLVKMRSSLMIHPAISIDERLLMSDLNPQTIFRGPGNSGSLASRSLAQHCVLPLSVLMMDEAAALFMKCASSRAL